MKHFKYLEMVLLVVLILLVGIVLSFTSKLKVNLISDSNRSQYFAVITDETLGFQLEQVRLGLNDAAEDSNVYIDCFYLTDENEQSVFSEVWYTNPDGIIVYLSNNEEVTDWIAKSEEQGYPVLLVGQDVPVSGRSAFIGSNKYTFGKYAADLALEGALDEPVIVFMNNQLNKSDSTSALNFMSGFYERINLEDISIEMIPLYIEDQRIELVAREVSIAYPNGTIIVTDALDSIRLIKVLIDLNKIKDYRIITSGNLEEINEYINKGTIYATLFEDYYNEGYDALELIRSVVNEDQQSPFISVPIEVIGGQSE